MNPQLETPKLQTLKLETPKLETKATGDLQQAKADFAATFAAFREAMITAWQRWRRSHPWTRC